MRRESFSATMAWRSGHPVDESRINLVRKDFSALSCGWECARACACPFSFLWSRAGSVYSGS